MDPADQSDQPDPGADRPDLPEQVRDQGPRLDHFRPRLDAASGSISNFFRFSQVELPWPVGPPDGRYLVRPPTHAPLRGAGDAPAEPSHVLVVAALTAVPRERRRQSRAHAQPEPEPASVPTSRVTIVGVGTPFSSEQAAREWLANAGEAELGADLAVLARALHAYRIASADPYVRPPGRREALVARIGFGAGEEVADGRWTDARELRLEESKRSRAERLAPQARFAAILAGRDQALASEELALRARLDLEEGRPREAALQVLLALDAALTELESGDAAPALQARLDELRGRRGQAERAARAALGASLSAADQDEVALTLARIEAALRARAVARG